ncbi:MAG: ATP-binding protein [Candidatus Eiseniibacteriota bacterium]
MGAAPTNPSHGSGDTTRLTIGSRLEELSEVYTAIEALAKQHNLNEELVNALQIAVIEAGTNAIQHGNAFAEDKAVTFDFTVDPKNIHVRVDDFGEGFDPSKVANPTDESRLLSPHGRGLYLMRSLMDEVTFRTRDDHGTTVVLVKARA